jgi:hypothetical protein
VFVYSIGVFFWRRSLFFIHSVLRIYYYFYYYQYYYYYCYYYYIVIVVSVISIFIVFLSLSDSISISLKCLIMIILTTVIFFISFRVSQCYLKDQVDCFVFVL